MTFKINKNVNLNKIAMFHSYQDNCSIEAIGTGRNDQTNLLKTASDLWITNAAVYAREPRKGLTVVQLKWPLKKNSFFLNMETHLKPFIYLNENLNDW